MKLKPTPLLVISVFLVLAAIIYMISGKGGNLGPLVGFIVIIAALAGLLVHFIFRKIFKSSTRKQVVAELLLVGLIGLVYFFKSGKMLLHVPQHFEGYILVVYGAEKGQPLKPVNFLTRDVDITVPASGVILTSAMDHQNISVIDSSHGKVQRLEPGYGVPSAWDTLTCGDKKYFLDVLMVGNLPADWQYTTDTLKRNLKKELACQSLSQ